MNLKALQEALSHGDARPTLNRYSHLIPSDSRDAADRMAEFLIREESAPLYYPSLNDAGARTKAKQAIYQRKCAKRPRSSGDRATVS